jgi:hypothetical protein
MAEGERRRALVSYAHENAGFDRQVRDFANQLRTDGVASDLDQYHDAPVEGWPGWMSGQIFDDGRFILVVASPSYARRWMLAECSGVGLGAKYEGRLIRQVLYAEEGLNGRVIPVMFSADDIAHMPRELQDTTRYDVSTQEGYDRLLRRLTDQPVVTAPKISDRVEMLAEQSPAIAAAFYVLQRVPGAMPLAALAEVTDLSPAELRRAIDSPQLTPWYTAREDELISTTYYRPVYPLPDAPAELFSTALEALLAYVECHGAHTATREQIDNALTLAAHAGVKRDGVARMFGVLQKGLKRLGDKRLVWRAAGASQGQA